jgi:hypothetical protein
VYLRIPDGLKLSVQSGDTFYTDAGRLKIPLLIQIHVLVFFIFDVR